MSELTHLDSSGHAHMVDIGGKPTSMRTACATGQVKISTKTLSLVSEGLMKKGDVLAVARIAGIQAAKQCASLIPLCHPLQLTRVDLDLKLNHERSTIDITATVGVNGQTGVEMEALTAVSVAALTVYDMCKSVDKGMVIESVQLETKTGGRSGDFRRNES